MQPTGSESCSGKSPRLIPLPAKVYMFCRELSPFGREKMDMKTVVGHFLVAGILVPYAPVLPMDECSGGGHTGIAKMDCGSLFRCPMIVGRIFSETSALPLRGPLVSIRLSPTVDELPDSVFHPPEYLIPDFWLREEEQLRRCEHGILAQGLLS
jgi:hypothetical protein